MKSIRGAGLWLFWAALLGLEVAAQEPFEPARSLARELVDDEPGRLRIVEIAAQARCLEERGDRRVVLDALHRHEERLSAAAFRSPDGGEPFADEERPHLVRSSLTEPFPRIRATRVAQEILGFGPAPSGLELHQAFESKVFFRQCAALHVLRVERSLMTKEMGEVVAKILIERLRSAGIGSGSPPTPELDEAVCLAAEITLEAGPTPEVGERAVLRLLEDGVEAQRLAALRHLALQDSVGPRLRWCLVRTLAARTVSEQELCAALLALGAVGVPPRSEWPPPRATLRRWLFSRRSTEEQRALAHECLSWVGPRDDAILPTLEALSEDPDRPRAAGLARGMLPALRARIDG